MPYQQTRTEITLAGTIEVKNGRVVRLHAWLTNSQRLPYPDITISVWGNKVRVVREHPTKGSVEIIKSNISEALCCPEAGIDNANDRQALAAAFQIKEEDTRAVLVAWLPGFQIFVL